ncbi:MAG: tagatose 1,6-diphosphate aldolase [Planctomycetes bacterium]|nr:tagatose 1,6-diphosphate aldolase [Planctomycetota bacterium]
MTTSVTRLLGLGLTPGKLRGLQRICNDNGTMTMVATDQNSSLIGLAKEVLKREPTYDEMVLAKNTLTRGLAPLASAILVDGYYGAWNAMASMALPRNTGLLIRVEKSGGGKNKVGAPLGCFEPGLGVRKIKLMGCDAVKLLAPFEPTEPASGEHQLHFIQQVYEDCRQHDILLLLETVAFAFGGEKKEDDKHKGRKAETVIESARQLSRFCDIYKAEFPGYIGRESDSQLIANLKALNAASERPWVLLSAGVDYPEYKKQVQMAMDCGASGILGGRAFWKEYFLQGDQAAREKWIKGESADRVRELSEFVRSKATPWYKWYGLTMEQIRDLYVAEGWHFRYAEPFTATDTAGERWGY